MGHERPWTGLQGQPPTSASTTGLPCHQRLERDWCRLEEHATLPSQMHTFHAALAATMMPGRILRLVTVNDGDQTVGILPLCRRRGWLSRWHAAGSRQVYEPIDALCRDEATTEALAGKLARLDRPLRLDRVPAASPLIPALRKATKGRGMIVTRPAQASPTLAFHPGETNPELRFNSGRRSDFRRARRRAEDLGAVSFEMHAPTPDTFQPLFEEAVAVEQCGWKGEAGSALGTDRAKASFFRDFLFGASRDGRCRIAFMRIDGRAVATQLAVEFQRRYWLFKIGFDQTFSRCSPGNLLMLYAMTDAATRRLAGVELLGEVEPWIIETWTRDAIECLRVQTYPFNVRGLAALVAEGAGWVWCRLPFRRAIA